MSPLVPAADREQLSRVRASLTQDGLDLAMIGHDRQQLLAYAAAIATGLADQGGWQVEKYDPTRLETLLADLTLARFDGALQTLSGQGYSQHDRTMRHCVLFIPDAQNLPRSQLQQLLRLLQGTGHRRLRIVALFSSSAHACEPQVAALGTQVARWYLDEVPTHLPNHAMLSTTPHQPKRELRQLRSTHTRKQTPVRAGFALAASLMLVLMLGPTLWPSPDQIARLLTPTPSLLPANANTLAGVPLFLPSEKKPSGDAQDKTDVAADALDSAAATDITNGASKR